MERHDTLEDDNGLWLQMDRLRQTVGDHIRIGGLFDGLTVSQLLDLLRQQFPVESIRMVEVNLLPFLGCQIRRIIIIRIQRDNDCTVRRQRFGNTLHDGGLART